MSLAESCSVSATHSKILSDCEWGSYLAESADEFSSADSDLLRAIHQSARSDQLSVYDALGMSLVLKSISVDGVLVVKVPVRGQVSSNHRTEDNQQLLSTLPLDFSATFTGRQADADGVFEWKRPLRLAGATIEAGFVPLEFGTTNAWTTWEHIAFHGGVARLPYGSEYLYLFITADIPFQSTL